MRSLDCAYACFRMTVLAGYDLFIVKTNPLPPPIKQNGHAPHIEIL
jgi:hypothetical protein